MSHTVAIIPLRGLHGGKSRLAADFDPAQRATLIATMARQVVQAVEESGVADAILIVSHDPAIATHLGLVETRASVVTQPDHVLGLNPAIELGRREAIRRGAGRALVLSADLPILTANDVRSFFDLSSDIGIAPDRAGAGTNALLLSGNEAVHRFAFHFGHESQRLHEQEARGLGFQATLVQSPGFALDLDTPEDWAILTGETQRRLLEPQPTPTTTIPNQRGSRPLAILEHA